MANTLTNVLPLILANGVKALRQRAVMASLVNRDYQSLAQEKGNVVNVPIPSAIAARAVTPAVTFAANVDASPTSAAVTLSRWMEAPLNLSDSDQAATRPDFMDMQLTECVKSLANDVDVFIFALHTGFFGAAGTAGTTPFNGSLNMAATAKKLLSQQLAQQDNRRAVIDPAAAANLLINSAVLNPFGPDNIATAGILEGTIGRKLGFDWYEDQNITQYTPGTAAASGFIASTLSGAIGNTTLNILNATATGVLNVGDIFTFTADVNSFQYAVTAVATICATVQKAISFYPALKTVVNTGATLIFISVPYTVNLAFHRDAIAFASRPLSSVFNAGNVFQAPTDPISGIALRVELSRQYKQETISLDILYGANVVRKELGCKILGQ